MFRQIAGRVAAARATGITLHEVVKELFYLSPMQLSVLLEAGWAARFRPAPAPPAAPGLGHPDRRSDLEASPRTLQAVMFDTNVPPGFPTTTLTALDHFSNMSPVSPAVALPLNLRWEHLIYAYLIENTRIYEIFRRVVTDLLTGESLGTPTPEAQAWLRSTEELFFREPPYFSIWSVASFVRPELRATRRNAYYRMFGMDLNHGTDDNPLIVYPKPEAANQGFVAVFQQFLRQVWVAIEYVTSTTGSNPTDNQAIANAARSLEEMLLDRRMDGNISREEFAFVSMMSWFHLTLEFDSPIVLALRANGTSAEQRLFKIADRVNLPAHKKAGDFLALALPMSRILIDIERGTYSIPAAVGALYTPGSPARDDMAEIIARWASTTSYDPKAVSSPTLAAARA